MAERVAGLIAELRGASSNFLDYSSRLSAFGLEMSNVTFASASVYELPFPDESFDLAFGARFDRASAVSAWCAPGD